MIPLTTVPMSTLCSIKSGKSDTKDAVEHGQYAFFDRSKIIKRSSRYLFDCEALIIAGEGAEFLPKHYDGKFDLHQRAYAIQNFSNNINVKYLFYYLHYLKDYLPSVAVGATVKSLRLRHFENLPVVLFPLATQKKIVAKLDAVFAEIDKATEVAETNARNAEALFQSYLSNIKAPDSSLGEHVTIKTGKLDSNASVENGKYPFFTCSKEIFSINDFAFDCEAVLLAGNNASGDFNVKHYKGKFNAYQRTYVITIDAIDKLTYRYLYFQLVNALKRFKNMSVGANTKFLKIGMIRDLKFSLPSMDEQIKILEILSAIETNTGLLKNSYLRRCELSNSLKQSILKQAFNGELVKE